MPNPSYYTEFKNWATQNPLFVLPTVLLIMSLLAIVSDLFVIIATSNASVFRQILWCSIGTLIGSGLTLCACCIYSLHKEGKAAAAGELPSPPPGKSPSSFSLVTISPESSKSSDKKSAEIEIVPTEASHLAPSRVDENKIEKNIEIAPTEISPPPSPRTKLKNKI